VYRDTRIGQGRENAKQYLRDNPALCEEINQRIREEVALGASQELSAVAQADVEDELAEEAL
jgi:recombination protein RecA